MLNLRPCDCELLGDMMKIRILTSKTDQLRQGDELVVARTGSSTCPVAMLEHYMAIYYRHVMEGSRFFLQANSED